MTHPTNRMSDDVHQRVRLGILAILDGAARADFRYLKDTLGVTDGNLGRHLQVLEESGLVKVDKVFERRRPRTWVSITREGKSALHRELTALKEMIAQLESAGPNRRDLAGAEG